MLGMTYSCFTALVSVELNSKITLLPPSLANRIVSNSDTCPDDAVVIKIDLLTLILESRAAQAIYYNGSLQKLLLLDPLKLAANLVKGKSSAKRQLVWRCFQRDQWLLLLRLISLGIGRRLRITLNALQVAPKLIFDDFVFESVEALQLLVLTLLKRCKQAKDGKVSLSDLKGIQKELKECFDSSSSVRVPSLLALEGQLAKVVTTAEKRGGVFADESGNEVTSLLTRLVQGLALFKVRALDSRSKTLDRIGAFDAIDSCTLIKGLDAAKIDNVLGIQLIVISHCTGCFGIREWAIRLVAKRMKALVRSFTLGLSDTTNTPYNVTAGIKEPMELDYLDILPRKILEYMQRRV